MRIVHRAKVITIVFQTQTQLKLQPYDLEPEIASSELSYTSSDDDISSSSNSEKDDDSRIGNISWCLCGGKCLRTWKAFAVVIQTKYLTIILKVNRKT